MARLKFAVHTLAQRVAGQSRDCPYCGGQSRKIGTKKLILEGRECLSCGLMFRWPRDDAEQSAAFYASEYRDPAITSLPTMSALWTLRNHAYSGTSYCVADRIADLKAVDAKAPLLDFGASWGYAVDQFNRAGLDAIGFDVDPSRTAYGREMGLNMVDSCDAIPDGSIATVYSSHVLEHLPDPRPAFETFRRVLRPGGLLALYLPDSDVIPWDANLSEVHQTGLSVRFLKKVLPEYGFKPLPQTHKAKSPREFSFFSIAQARC